MVHLPESISPFSPLHSLWPKWSFFSSYHLIVSSLLTSSVHTPLTNQDPLITAHAKIFNTFDKDRRSKTYILFRIEKRKAQFLKNRKIYNPIIWNKENDSKVKKRKKNSHQRDFSYIYTCS